MSLPKPNIAAVDFEFDARPTQESPVVTWEDTSGQGNDGTGVNTPTWEPTGWRPEDRNLGVVDFSEFAAMPASADYFTFDGSGLIGTDLTVFWVAEHHEPFSIITGGGAIGGGDNLKTLFITVQEVGKLVFGFFDTGSGINDLFTAAGTVSDGERVIVTMRHSTTDGKLIRLNGVEVLNVPTATANLADWLTPWVGRTASGSSHARMAWLSAHRVAASVTEMREMEAWLLQEFGPRPGFPRVVVPESVSALTLPGAVKRRTNAGLTQIRSITAIGWSWRETYPLLRVTDPDHAELMAFIKGAWHQGDIFLATHPLRPGSGILPNGLGTVNIMVVGAGQTGASVLTDGWPTNTPACVVVGDVIQIAGEVAVYVATATVGSDGAGEVTVPLNPPLRSSPADNALVATTSVQFQVTILNRSRFEAAQSPNLFGNYEVTFGEALL